MDKVWSKQFIEWIWHLDWVYIYIHINIYMYIYIYLYIFSDIQVHAQIYAYYVCLFFFTIPHGLIRWVRIQCMNRFQKLRLRQLKFYHMFRHQNTNTLFLMCLFWRVSRGWKVSPLCTPCDRLHGSQDPKAHRGFLKRVAWMAPPMGSEVNFYPALVFGEFFVVSELVGR